MKSFVVGRGEIGKAVTGIIGRVDDVVSYDLRDGAAPDSRGVDLLHICFPFNDEFSFLAAVDSYIAKYQPVHVIIWSTVPIGTTKQIKGVVHSPVEGRHPHLELSIRKMRRWIGANDQGEGEFWAQYFRNMKLETCLVASSDYTEFLKLRSTSKYGINLAWTDYEAGVSKELGMPFSLLQQFDRDYNALYQSISMPWARRYILNPPQGVIGGHCVVPNAKLLNKQFPSKLLDKIIEMEKG